ncbi:hypothetical protein SAMN06265375_10511 [Muriicola jejuensis]|uniref:Ribonuclease HII n=1 Tax=Muriicola jejuensis TaxID=504488 RepID=A0A6P0UGZ9_9FLAO|nr:ribonuclease HII [Muriicola jejuensis]NER11740.1 ribonuclease HII [Muriicola jejuensis]SMP24892.1 hypothetical protein SAMN06265375_10511 [Muriicola jejuensis]
MKGFLAIGLIALLITACNPLDRSDRTPEEAIPQNAVFILKVHDPAAAKRELEQNDYNSGSVPSVQILTFLSQLNDLNIDEPGYLAALPAEGDSLSYLYISRVPGQVIEVDSLDPTDETPVDSLSSEAAETQSESGFSKIRIGNLEFRSRDSGLLNDLRESDFKDGPPLKLLSLLKKSGSGKPLTLFVDSDKADSLDLLNQKESSRKWSDLAGTLALDLSTASDKLQWTGVGVPNDSLPSLLTLFEHTQPTINSLASLAPEGADGILTLSFTDHTVFAENQRKSYPKARASDTLFRTVEEIGLVFQGNNRAVLMNTYGALSLSEYLLRMRSSSYDYQGKEIGELSPDDLLEAAFPSLLKDFKFTHYTALDNAFVFSESKEFLELIIRNINSGSTYDTSASYQSAREELAEASSLLLLGDKDKMEKIAAELLPSGLVQLSNASSMQDPLLAFQVVADRSFSHLNLLQKRKSGRSRKQGVNPRFTIQLDAPLANTPQFVTDHRNNKKEIVVQDSENNLYLISSEGKILWKKELGGPVQGRIEQIDLYKNGRLQLAFTTSNQFLVLDRNGKEVAPFTKKFPGAILNPLAVFDYEGNRNYRFVVTQGSDVRMYNGKGNTVSGFKYTKAESAVLDRPKHFRIGTRDYLVFRLEDGTLKILNRVGDTRVAVNEKIDFSENDVYLYNDKFIVTDKTGTLFSIDTRGKLTNTRFNLAKDHGMDATVKTLCLMNDNELTIKGNKASLDLGVYTKPRIFYVYDKIYVSVTDIQTQRAYLFDSNAIPFTGFPVYANSPIDLSDIDNDRRVEIAAKFEENSLIVYSLN